MSAAETLPNATPARRPWWKRVLRFFAWTGGIFVLLLFVLLTLTYIYQDKVKGYVIAEVNKRVNTEIIIDPADIDLTIIRTFPDVTVEFKNVAALDAIPTGKRDTLLKAGKISFAFNLPDLFRSNYTIRDIAVEDATLNVWVDEKGKDNYHLLKEAPDTVATDTSHVNFALSTIAITNVRCIYSDKADKSRYDVTFGALDFSGDFSADRYELGTNGGFTVTQIKYGKTSYFENSSGVIDLVLAIDNTAGTYTFKTGQVQLAELALNIAGSIAEQKENYRLDLSVAGENIDLPACLSLLSPEEAKALESTGDFYLDGTIKGLVSDSTTPAVNAQFGIKSGATIGRKGSDVKLTDVSLKGLFSNEKGKEGLQLNSFTASSARSKFSGSFSMSGFSRPRYKAELSGHIDLSELQDILRVDTITAMSGTLDLEVNASGAPSKSSTLTASDFRTFKTSGQAKLTNAMVQLKDAKFPTDSISGKLAFDGNNVTVEGFTARQAGSDIRVDGSVRNLLGYLFLDKEVLDVSGKLVSKNLELDSLLANKEKSGPADTSAYYLELPGRLKLNFSTSIKRIKLDKFEAYDVTGDLHLNKRRLTADPFSFRAMDGTISGSGMIDGTQADSLLITCNADIKSVNIYKMFYQLNNFGQGEDTAITYNNLRGIVTSKVNFASVWGNNLEVDEKKIYADADITIANGQLVNFLPLDALSRFIQLEDLRNIKFSSLHNTITISNRTISLPKMEIKSSAIDLVMWGTHDFDNMVDYHFIVAMDELRAKKVKAAKKQNQEFGEEIPDERRSLRLFLNMKGYIGDPKVGYEEREAFRALKEDLAQERKNLGQVLKSEFGWGKKTDKDGEQEDRKKEGDGDKFILVQDDEAPPKDKKKKKDDENLDDSEDF